MAFVDERLPKVVAPVTVSEDRVPTLVREELITNAPRVVALST